MMGESDCRKLHKPPSRHGHEKMAGSSYLLAEKIFFRGRRSDNHQSLETAKSGQGIASHAGA